MVQDSQMIHALVTRNPCERARISIARSQLDANESAQDVEMSIHQCEDDSHLNQY
jgi:hypothetical protein